MSYFRLIIISVLQMRTRDFKFTLLNGVTTLQIWAPPTFLFSSPWLLSPLSRFQLYQLYHCSFVHTPRFPHSFVLMLSALVESHAHHFQTCVKATPTSHLSLHSSLRFPNSFTYLALTECDLYAWLLSRGTCYDSEKYKLLALLELIFCPKSCSR